MRLNQWHDVPGPTWERMPDGTHNGAYPDEIPAYLYVSRYGAKLWRWAVQSKKGDSPKAPLSGFAPTWHEARKAAHRAYRPQP